MYDSIKQCARTEFAVQSGCNFPLSSTEVTWLGLCAFEKILDRKQTKYKIMLKAIKSKMEEPSFDHMKRSSVIDPVYSKAFEDFVY